MKHRARASELVAMGAVRINRIKADKSSQTVKPGDVLTLAVGRNVEVIKVLSEPERRGPPASATAIYERLQNEDVKHQD